MIRHRALGAALASCAIATALTGLSTATSGPAAATSTSFCGLTGFSAAHSYVWTGADASHDNSWQTAGNWDVGGVPAANPPGDPYDSNGPGDLDTEARDVDYVCIGHNADGTAANVTLGGEYFAGAAIAALDLGQNAHLTVTGNSRLWLNRANSANQPSTVRPNTTLDLEGATLGGKGTLVVSGTLDAASTDQYPVTITSRWCDVGDDCSGPPAHPGRLTVAAGGRFVVNGAPSSHAGGINLEDERFVDNSGTLRIANKGYIAADRGTTIDTEPGGTIEIDNDLGIYEGRNDFGTSHLPALRNDGALIKAAGSGTSVMGVAYQTASTGTVSVASGGLSLDRSGTSAVSIPAGSVGPGSTYGLGACNSVTATNPDSCASPVVDGSSPQAATVTLSASATTSTVQVATQTTGLPAGALGQAVQFETPNATPTTSRPDLFVLTYDSSVLSGKTVSTITMMRADDNNTNFAPVPNCRSDGSPPTGQSCVDKRGRSGSSQDLPGGDVRIVIRTTQNSRWVAS